MLSYKKLVPFLLVLTLFFSLTVLAMPKNSQAYCNYGCVYRSGVRYWGVERPYPGYIQGYLMHCGYGQEGYCEGLGYCGYYKNLSSGYWEVCSDYEYYIAYL